MAQLKDQVDVGLVEKEAEQLKWTIETGTMPQEPYTAQGNLQG